MEEKSTFNSTEEFAALWSKLSHNQQRFAVAMLQCSSKKEAAELIKIEPNTVYKWNGEIDAIVEFMRNDYAAAAVGILAANSAKAAMVKVKGLDSGDEKIRQAVATEIIDRNLGKPTQRQEVTGAEGGAVVVKVIEGARDVR